MSKILTQEEIDTLMGGIAGGEAFPLGEGDDAVAEVVPYNFMNQDRIVRGGMPTLEIIHDRFARLLRMGMTQTMRRTVDVQVLNNMEQRFGEFIRTLPQPASLHVLRMDPLKGHGMLVLSGQLVYTMIEVFFGGSSIGTVKKDARDFTMVEQRIISNLTATIDRQYSRAWKAVFPLTIESGDSETNPQFINIAQPSDKVIGIDYEVTIDGLRCGLSICLPYGTIEPLKETLKGSMISEDAEADNSWGRQIRRELKEASVDIRAMLGSADITVHDLLKLKNGDVIQLHEDYEHPIEILVENVPKFWGKVGSHKSARSVQVTGIRAERGS